MSGQGYRTRHGWTTSEAPDQVIVPPPNRFVRDDPPAWVWAAVLAITAALIFLLVYLEAFK